MKDNATEVLSRWIDRIAIFFASGFGSGFIPKAPGTWGSLVGCFLIWKFWGSSIALQMTWIVLCGALGGWASDVTLF
jgi:phosphatidylglycerophosphatase A